MHYDITYTCLVEQVPFCFTGLGSRETGNVFPCEFCSQCFLERKENIINKLQTPDDA